MAQNLRSLTARGPLWWLSQQPPQVVRAAALITAAAVSLGILLAFAGPLRNLEEQAGALGWTLIPERELEQRVTIIAIDERSLAAVGPWPWPRTELARLVRALTAAGVQLQLHDIVYAEPKSGDDALIQALSEAPGAVLAQVPVLQDNALDTNTGSLTHPVSGVSCAVTDSSAANAGVNLSAAQGFLAPAANFTAIPKGHITPIIDTDGAVRRTPALVCQGGSAYPALAISAFLQMGGNDAWEVSLSPGSGLLGPQARLNLRGYPGLNIPVDAEGNIRIPYDRAPESYLALSAIDVMNGNFDPNLLANTWVLVGGTAFGMGDIVPTPYSGAAPGVELQARLLTGLLDVRLPFSPATAPAILLLLSLVFAAVSYSLARAGERIAAYGLPTAALLLPIAAVLFHSILLASANIWLGWLAPALFGALASSLLLIVELNRIRGERARVYGNLASYLPAEVARDIAFSLPSSNILAEKRDVTLLSADLRNFSSFGETRTAEESAAVLHFFFSRATAIIEQHRGRVHEFKGDGLLAIWDGCDAKAAESALASAEELQFALTDSLLPKEMVAGIEPLALGVGIEQGPVLIGSIGPAHRRSHALLGATVSIALRIQEMTVDLAQPVLLGECVARQLPQRDLQSQGSYLLSGLTFPHTLFALRAGRESQTRQRNKTSKSARPNLSIVLGGRS